ncbi:hypothetical protein PEDI_46830 [Persicobacter diffluens]|uniref:Uncharacterized protein n=1 Tax=Persicobacter diffluens TaxID=981 RepID=A0AAN4W1U6_9BACT|nr:hypothetical protein PEDI_46830 [Persicobacter diffluens]
MVFIKFFSTSHPILWCTFSGQIKGVCVEGDDQLLMGNIRSTILLKIQVLILFFANKSID